MLYLSAFLSTICSNVHIQNTYKKIFEKGNCQSLFFGKWQNLIFLKISTERRAPVEYKQCAQSVVFRGKCKAPKISEKLNFWQFYKMSWNGKKMAILNTNQPVLLLYSEYTWKYNWSTSIIRMWLSKWCCTWFSTGGGLGGVEWVLRILNKMAIRIIAIQKRIKNKLISLHALAYGIVPVLFSKNKCLQKAHIVIWLQQKSLFPLWILYSCLMQVSENLNLELRRSLLSIEYLTLR